MNLADFCKYYSSGITAHLLVLVILEIRSDCTLTRLQTRREVWPDTASLALCGIKTQYPSVLETLSVIQCHLFKHVRDQLLCHISPGHCGRMARLTRHEGVMHQLTHSTNSLQFGENSFSSPWRLLHIITTAAHDVLICYIVHSQGIVPLLMQWKAHLFLCGHQGWCTRWFRCCPSWGFPCILCGHHRGSICRTAHSLPGRSTAHNRTNKKIIPSFWRCNLH